MEYMEVMGRSYGGGAPQILVVSVNYSFKGNTYAKIDSASVWSSSCVSKFLAVDRASFGPTEETPALPHIIYWIIRERKGGRKGKGVKGRRCRPTGILRSRYVNYVLYAKSYYCPLVLIKRLHRYFVYRSGFIYSDNTFAYKTATFFAIFTVNDKL